MQVKGIIGFLTFCCWIQAGTPTVLPQFVMGGGWYTALYFTNATASPVNFQVSFFGDNGQPMSVPRPGLTPASVHSLNLSARGTAHIEAPNSGSLMQGWALVDLPAGVTGYAVFRQTVAGVPDQEAVVPLTGTSSRSATLVWDNTDGLVTAAAVLNPSNSPTIVQVTARNEVGQILGIAQLPLPAKSKTAFVLSDQSGLAGLVGQRGSADFTVAAPAAVAVLGLRFKGTAFTSTPPAVDLVDPDLIPALIPAPSLQATALSPTQVRLSWTNNATGVIRYRIERKTGAGGTFAEIAQPGSAATTYDDSGLATATAYSYRIRAETSAGFSPYSNEVSATTSQGLPAAPTNLQATATSSSQANLIWTNNAPDATVIRVESRPAGSATFTDIGAAATLTSTGVTGLQPNTSYTFRVRAQNAAGYSSYSNEASITTLPVPKTVFLIHGINQDRSDMQGLYDSLTGSLGIDLRRFRVDVGFDFRECADATFCDSNCSISAGAQKLARYINTVNPPGDIVLVGFSMGGLISRDMIANNWNGVLNARKVAGLVTLGTPSLGYPYTYIDRIASCTPLLLQMDGNWRSKQAQGVVVLSDYLLNLTNQWGNSAFPGNNRVWLAASGRSCSNPIRNLDNTTGCRDSNPYSDGVVCDDSATYWVNTAAGTRPSRYWQDPGGIYVHSHDSATGFILCGNSGDDTRNPLLSNPPVFGPLFSALKETINGL